MADQKVGRQEKSQSQNKFSINKFAHTWQEQILNLWQRPGRV